MAYLGIEEITKNDGLSMDEKGYVKVARKFIVYVDYFNDETFAGLHPLLPARFSRHPSWIWSVARTVKVVRYPNEDSMGTFLVTLEYDSSPFNQNDKGNDPKDSEQKNDKKARPIQIKYSSTKVQEPMSEDLSEPTPEKIVNSAGMPFEPPYTAQRSRTIIGITGYCEQSDIVPNQWREGFIDHVNYSAWTLDGYTYGARTLRVNEYNVTPEYDGSSGYYYKLDVTLEHKKEGWQPRIVDMGTMQKTYTGQGTYAIRPIEINGVVIRKPVPLDGFGAVLAQGASLVYVPNPAVVPGGRFTVYEETSFTYLLPLGITIP